MVSASFKRPDDLIRVAHRNHGRDVESGQTRRLEPHARQHRHLRFLDDHERRGRQRGEIRLDLGDVGSVLFDVERAFLLQAQRQVDTRSCRGGAGSLR